MQPRECNCSLNQNVVKSNVLIRRGEKSRRSLPGVMKGIDLMIVQETGYDHRYERAKQWGHYSAE